MWQNSSEEDMYAPLPLPEESGWMKSDDCYSIDWEAADLQEKIQKSIDFLTKGCSYVVVRKVARLPIVDAEKGQAIVGQHACVRDVLICKPT